MSTSVLLLILSQLTVGNAFRYPSVAPRTALRTKLQASSQLGDLFSGIIGVAPSSLEPPSDVLLGTSIDPSRDDVDLGRVYKASKDGWSAIDFHKAVGEI